jgi:hypothetical protein
MYGSAKIYFLLWLWNHLFIDLNTTIWLGIYVYIAQLIGIMFENYLPKYILLG